ncbi:MAG: tripartite tricarboxylate transporter substrate binding protein [Burkholderiaceae bacterium]|nr:tripartite tricarboxylate transporter substrate binding protein [Burkholderiaceae bacterium]
MNHRRTLGLWGLALAASAWNSPALAQTYPSQTIKVVVPYAPGGPTDIVARVVADKLGQLEKVTVIVENRPGGGANIGAEAAAKSAPDGYTLLVASATHTINATLFPQLGYDLVRDFAPVSTLTSGPMLLVTQAKSPWRNLQDLVTKAKAQPGGLSFASSGNGASTHLAGEMLKARAGMHAVHIPYRGSGPALTDTMGGQTAYMFDTMLSALPFVTAGKLRALAITSLERSPLLPQIPTVAEQGYPGFEAIAWNGILVPAKTPPEVVAHLNARLKTILAMPEVREKFVSQGFSADWRSPEDFRQYLQAEIKKWGVIVKTAHVKMD